MTSRVLMQVIATILILVVLVPNFSNGMPSGVISRQKRVSDQRLAELETLMALSRLKGKLVTVPIGFGRVDPAKIGRKRRSSTVMNIQDLRRFLKSFSQASKSGEDGSAEMFPASWKDTDDWRGNEMKDPPLI